MNRRRGERNFSTVGRNDVVNLQQNLFLDMVIFDPVGRVRKSVHEEVNR